MSPSAKLDVQLGPIALRNPVLTASGTFGYGKEYAELVPLDQLGGITVKGVSPFPCDGNPTPRTREVFGGLLNSIGLQNPGLQRFISHPDYLPWLRQLDTAVLVNIWGRTMADYVEVAARLEEEKDGIAGLEINISCPNVKAGGLAFGANPELAGKLVAAVREVTTLPLITKLSPNAGDIVGLAQSVVDSGSDVVSLINTFPALAIDIHSRTPRLGAGTGGLSGPAIKPIAVKMVYDVSRAIAAPVIGMGGVYSAEDAIEFLLAGASAVAVGTAIFADPMTPIKVLDGLQAYLDENGCSSVADIVGQVRMP